MNGMEAAFASEVTSSGAEVVEAESLNLMVASGPDGGLVLLIEVVGVSRCGAMLGVVQRLVTGLEDSSCRTLDGEATRQREIYNASVHHTFIRGSKEDSGM